MPGDLPAAVQPLPFAQVRQIVELLCLELAAPGDEPIPPLVSEFLRQLDVFMENKDPYWRIEPHTGEQSFIPTIRIAGHDASPPPGRGDAQTPLRRVRSGPTAALGEALDLPILAVS